MLTFLGECLYHTAKYEAALKELTRSLNIQTECEEKDRTNVNNVQTLKYLALAKAKLRHEDTLASLKTASERAK